jgi:release factor glutamine methyltransferase
VTGVDTSEEALQVARANARRLALHQVALQASNWFDGVAGRRFDLLLANPPYIDGGDEHLARGDVRFEPRTALVAPRGGLADLGVLAADAPGHLRDGGWLLLEHGWEQAATVRGMLRDAGFGAVSSRRDLAGHERVTGGCWRAD